jgi:hypothetical protein
MSGTQIEEATALVTGGNRGLGRAMGAGAARPRRYQGLRDLALTPAADRGARRPAERLYDGAPDAGRQGRSSINHAPAPASRRSAGVAGGA